MFTYLTFRNGIAHYMRRVPKEYAQIDQRRFVKKSLDTRDPQEALKKALNYNDIVEAEWKKLFNATATDPFTDFLTAVKRAEFHGFSYRNVSEIAESPLERIIERLDQASKAIEEPETVSALLGGHVTPKLLLTECIDKYFPLCADILVNKSEHQKNKWRNPRRKALDDFIQIVGSDMAIHDLKRKHALDFEEHLRNEIKNENLVGDTANKKIRFVRDILSTVGKKYEIDVNFRSLFSEIKFKEFRVSRPSFEASYVQDTYLQGEKLSGLNFEARMLLYAMCDTGARESEIIGLRPQDIFLDEPIPHIWIRPYKGHSLKTRNSERIIPLVGASLYAMRKMRYGFRRYKTADSASTTINKFLKENRLVPSPEHSLYSLRHTFKDRLRDATKDVELRDELMGHSNKRPHYGRGYLLEDKYELLKEIAFKVSE